MVKKFCSGLLFGLLFSGIVLCAAENDKIAYLKEMLNQHKSAEQGKIEKHFADKRDKMWGESAVNFALAALTSRYTADAIIKMVNSGIDAREMTVACVGGVAAAWLLLRMVGNSMRLGKLSAEKVEMLEQLEEHVQELRAEIKKQEKQAREDAKRARQEKEASKKVKSEPSVEAAVEKTGASADDEG